MRRVVVPELLDTDCGTPQEVQASIADLRRVNRWFGGVETTCAMISEVARLTGTRNFSLLEVASASGDVPLAARRRLAGEGIELSVTLLDRAASHLNGYKPSVVGDALALPFSDSSFDIVSCGLFAHHLEPDQVIAFTGEALRVCRVVLIINDLRRSALHLALIYAGFPLFRSRLTRHDAPASVRRAYTPGELESLLRKGGAADVRILSRYLYRMGAIVLKAGCGNRW